MTRTKKDGEERAPVAIDLFAGAGGLSEGLLAAGIRVAASVELHPQPSLTHAFNHPATGVLVGDVRDLDLDLLEQVVRENVDTSTVDLVVGGPPCQGFSSAGRKASSDPRNSLFQAFVKVIVRTRPRMFLMENVPGFRSMYQGRVYGEACAAFRALGYEFVDDVVVAAKYGVPQRRRRFVMVGWLPGDAEPFEWPEATHVGLAEQNLLDLTLAPTPTAGDALADLSFVEPGYEATRYLTDPQSEFAIARRNGNGLLFNQLATRHRLKAVEMFERIPVGGSIRMVEEHLKSKKVTMVRLNPNAVSNTIVSLPDDILHFAHHRILSVRECARLQTFDDDFVFIGKRTSGFVERRVDVPQYTQVGNAVPPILGIALGRALLRSLGLPGVDLRDLARRRERHAFVCGSSGYAGYTLAPEAKREIVLRTVQGDQIELPTSDSDTRVTEQAPLRDWKAAPNPRRGQWAPGVIAKDRPSWMAQPDPSSAG
jgi:DNA (cytosine-5)-methyltransferase 1